MACRIDKYIWSVRLAKTRSKAAEAINKGKVKLNYITVKPSREVQIGDRIQVLVHNAAFEFEVLELLEKRVGAKLVSNYILDKTEPIEIEKHKLFLSNRQTFRDAKDGKPSKKQRRDLDEFLENW